MSSLLSLLFYIWCSAAIFNTIFTFIIYNERLMNRIEYWEDRWYIRKINKNPEKMATRYVAYVLTTQGSMRVSQIGLTELYDHLVLQGVTKKNADIYIRTIEEIVAALV